MKDKKIQKLTKGAIFMAIIVAMTVVPYTGYISYGLVIEITTLHIPVIIGALLLGPAYGALLGGVWGVTCLVRAFTNPLWAAFTNPLISVVPRVLVGLVAGLVFRTFAHSKAKPSLSAAVTAAAATLTNTLLVLTAIYFFGGMLNSFAEFFEMFKTIYLTIISVNGLIELGAAVVLVPIIYCAVKKSEESR